MGSNIKLNDTLEITTIQGFPKELSLERHLKNPFTAKDFAGKVFAFRNKSGIRVYHAPPVRNFLVENCEGKWTPLEVARPKGHSGAQARARPLTGWIYWGLCEVLSVTHDNEKQTTSGTFRILYIYTPDEMKQAHTLIDRNPKTQFFT